MRGSSGLHKTREHICSGPFLLLLPTRLSCGLAFHCHPSAATPGCERTVGLSHSLQTAWPACWKTHKPLKRSCCSSCSLDCSGSCSLGRSGRCSLDCSESCSLDCLSCSSDCLKTAMVAAHQVLEGAWRLAPAPAATVTWGTAATSGEAAARVAVQLTVHS